ncbi:MAG: hypothetical protein ACRC0G_12185 [Fusobacteriaceae bacterium]
MLSYSVDLIKRCVVLKVENEGGASLLVDFIINEHDTLKKKFLPNTNEEYECELVLVDVEKKDEKGEKTGEVETLAFSKRKGYENWLMIFEPEEYTFE